MTLNCGAAVPGESEDGLPDDAVLDIDITIVIFRIDLISTDERPAALLESPSSENGS
jgi:hypothetical protein